MKKLRLFLIFSLSTIIQQIHCQENINLVSELETRKAAEIVCNSVFGKLDLYDKISYYDIGGERTCDVYIFKKHSNVISKQSLIDSIYSYRYNYFKYSDSIRNIDQNYKQSDIKYSKLELFRTYTDKYLYFSTRPNDFVSIYTSASTNHYPIFEYREGLPESFVQKYDIENKILQYQPEIEDFIYFGPAKLFILDRSRNQLVNLLNPDYVLYYDGVVDFRYNSIVVDEDKERVDSLWDYLRTNSLEVINKSNQRTFLAAYTIPNVPYFRQNDWSYILPPLGCCEVMAASSIFGKYDNQGYWNLVGQAWYNGPPNNSSAGFGFYPGLNEVKTVCGVNKNMRFGPESTVYYLAYDLSYNFCSGGTPVSCTGSNDMQNKWPQYSNTRLGLSFVFDSDCGALGGHYYSTIKTEINANKPMALWVDHFSWTNSGGPYPYLGGHCIAIVAYDESNSVGGDPIGVYINGTSSYSTIWWNYAQIRNDNAEITMKITPGGTSGTWINAPGTGSPSGSSSVCAGNVSFNWQNVSASLYRVQIASNDNFTSIVYDFTTTSTSATKSITTPGTYYWRVMPRNSSNTWCHFNDNTFVFTVNQAPSQPGTISGNSTPCVNSNQQYSVSAVSGATSYNWTIPSGWTGSSTSNSINTVAGTTSGTISVTAANACGTSSARTKSVTVSTSPAQPGSISGNSSPCQGSSQTYSISSVSGATSYSWSLPSGWTGSSTSTSITTTVGSTSGNVSVTANNSCGNSSPRTLTITVWPLPSQPGTISGTSNPCQNSSQTYSVNPVTGASSYIWTLPAGWSGSSTTNSILTTVGSSSGNITVAAINSCGTGQTRSLSVSSTLTPIQPGAISGNTSPCANSSQSYSVTNVTGATSYNWTLPSGWTGTSTTNTISVTVGNNPGTITVSASNLCGTSPVQSLSVSVSPTPQQPGAISGTQNPCQSTSQQYAVTPVSGASSYTWTIPPDWSGSSSSNSITVSVGSSSGQLTVTANNACGPSQPSSQAITVTPIPPQPGVISGNSNPCPSSTETYSITPIAGATFYNWTLPAGYTGSSSSSSISVTVGTSNGSIAVTAGNSCGVSSSSSLNITLNSSPSQPGAITGNSSPCQGSNQSYSVNPIAGATSYIWTLPSGWTGSSNTNTIMTTVGASSGDIIVIASNMCGNSPSSSLAVTTSPIPATAGPISGNTSPCVGISENYIVSPINGATSYNWTLPSGWTGYSNTNTISVIVGSSTGSISVSGNNTCGQGQSSSITVQPLSIPSQPGAISGNSLPCAGGSETYSITPVSGANSYTWSIPAGWSGSSTTNSISVSVGTNGGNISVIANNDCGASTPSVLSTSIQPLPSVPGTISGPNSVCQGSTQSYSVEPVSGATSYIWSIPAGWAGTSTTNTLVTTIGQYGGTISVAANNNCGSGPSSTLAVSVNPLLPQPGTITGNTNPCSNTTELYSVQPVAGATSYTWVLPSGWIGSSTTNSINVTTSNNSGQISVTANNDCGASQQSVLNITVSTLPSQPANISGNTNPCIGQNTIYSVDPVTGANSYIWQLPGGWMGSSSTNYIEVIVGSNSGSISVTASNNCGLGLPSSPLIVFVSPIPLTPVITQQSNHLISNYSQGNQWYNPAGIIDTAIHQTFYPPVANYYYTIVTQNNCQSQPSNIIYFQPVESIDVDLPEISFYPNPTSGELWIKYYTTTNEESIKLEIYTETGEKVHMEIIPISSQIINHRLSLKNIAPGVYIIKVLNKNTRTAQKLIIM